MEKKVQLPALALIVVAGLTVLFVITTRFMNEALLKIVEQAQLPEDQLQQMRAMWETSSQDSPLNILGLVLTLGGSALIAFGAWRMKDLHSWGLAVTASILAMIPCFSSCCSLVGLPVGIWALVVLLDKDVKAAFGAPTVPPPL